VRRDRLSSGVGFLVFQERKSIADFCVGQLTLLAA